MYRFLEVAGAGLIVALIGTVLLLKTSRKRITPEQDADGCKVKQLFPDPNDPDYAIDRDNLPTWKEVQNN